MEAVRNVSQVSRNVLNAPTWLAETGFLAATTRWAPRPAVGWAFVNPGTRGDGETGRTGSYALNTDELANILRARLEVHPEVHGFPLEHRPRGLASSPGADEFLGRGVVELETELVEMRDVGDDRSNRGDAPVKGARALYGTITF